MDCHDPSKHPFVSRTFQYSNKRTIGLHSVGAVVEATLCVPQTNGYKPPIKVGYCFKKRVIMAFFALFIFGCGSGEKGTQDINTDVFARCSDEKKNGDEEGVDCGGSCPDCRSTSPAGSPIREYFARFMMPIERDGCTTLHRPQSIRPWNNLYPGRCAGCGIPSRISSAAFGDTLIVAWVASAAYTDLEEPQRGRYGHLSTFTFTEKDGFIKVNDFFYEGCDIDMGSVAASPDGSVIGALCHSDNDKVIAGTINPPTEPSGDPSRQKDLYLFEWTGGKITQNPDTIVLLTRNAGGWNSGHLDLSLNNSSTQYYVEAKAATSNGHESTVRFGIDRLDGYSRVNWGGGCGGGHTISNRITHNKHDDTWTVYCSTDPHNMIWRPIPPPKYISTVDHSDMGIEIGDEVSIVKFGEFEIWGSFSDAAGGVANMISLGSKGWLAAAHGPFDIFADLGEAPSKEAIKAKLTEQQIGFRRLPLTVEEFLENEDDYRWNWIDLDDTCAPTKGGDRRTGKAQIHNWGLGGEDSGRILLGYVPKMGHTGNSNEHHVVEVNEHGLFMHDPVVLQKGAWGIDSLGTYMPGSGCVVFPFAWVPDDPENGTAGSYPHHYRDPVTDRSKFLKLTAVCPTGNALQKSPGPCQTQLSELSEGKPESLPAYESECPNFQQR